MTFVSLKHTICKTYASHPANSTVTFLTSAGLVSGKLASATPYQLEQAGVAFAQESRNTGRTEGPDDEYLLLKEVTIQPHGGGEPIKEDYLVLFTGSVVGIIP